MVASLVGGEGEFPVQRTDCVDNNVPRWLLLERFQNFDSESQAEEAYLYLHYDAKIRIFGIFLLLF